MTEALKVMVGSELLPTEETGDLIGEDVVGKRAIIPGFIATTEPIDIEKLARNRRNKAKLISRLKRRRHYSSPVRGGTGKQARTRRKKFG